MYGTANPNAIGRDVLYKQLNERSRMYTSQLWQVPGLYFALMAWVSDQFPSFEAPQKAVVCFFMAATSVRVWVFVSQLKFMERHAVNQMQLLEGIPLSTGGSPWFFSFIWYVRALLVAATFAFFVVGVLSLSMPDRPQFIAIALGGLFLLVGYAALAAYDHRRSKQILNEIRNA